MSFMTVEQYLGPTIPSIHSQLKSEFSDSIPSGTMIHVFAKGDKLELSAKTATRFNASIAQKISAFVPSASKKLWKIIRDDGFCNF